jgi:hypothetical protein
MDFSYRLRNCSFSVTTCRWTSRDQRTDTGHALNLLDIDFPPNWTSPILLGRLEPTMVLGPCISQRDGTVLDLGRCPCGFATFYDIPFPREACKDCSRPSHQHFACSFRTSPDHASSALFSPWNELPFDMTGLFFMAPGQHTCCFFTPELDINTLSLVCSHPL